MTTEQVRKKDHVALAIFAADCAARVLARFEDKAPNDDRPRRAIEAAHRWARGEVKTNDARTAAFAAHAAARDVEDESARAAARAAGHAASTPHVPTHAAEAASCAVRAAADGNEERAWQLARLPEHLAALLTRAPGRSR